MTPYFKFSFLMISSGLLFGCAVPDGNDDVSSTKKEISVKSSLDHTPAWYANPPFTKDELFVSGTGTSADMQIAMDKAILVAKRALAEQIASYISTMTRQIAKEVNVKGKNILNQSLENITKTAASNVNIGGFNKESSKIVQNGEMYRAFVLISFPKEEAKRALLMQIKNESELNNALRKSKSLNELEASLNR